MFGSEKLKFQVLTAVSQFGTSIHQISASLENVLSGKNKNLKKFVLVEGYKKWFCVFHIFATITKVLGTAVETKEIQPLEV
jgi:hypothetical protein